MADNSKESLITKDSVLQFFVQEAQKHTAVQKLVLYGSRARHDNDSRSDYDIALQFFENATHLEQAKVRLALVDDAPTLCKIDVVTLTQSTQPDLRNRIRSEGFILFERKSNVRR